MSGNRQKGVAGRLEPGGSARLLTVGHGTLDAEGFLELLRAVPVARVVDVRRHPGSRRHPHFSSGPMTEWLGPAGITYRWEERLGGRRRGGRDSPHWALRAAGFRAYADHMQTPAFRQALTGVLEEATTETTAVMCAESLWWRCHRRLVADAALLLREVEVLHLLHDGTLQPHRPTEGVRVADGALVYDVGVDRPLPGGEDGG